jgi:Ca2+-binding RTX toxin-like protein
MKIRTFIQITFIGLITLILVSTVTAFAANLNVTPSNIGYTTRPVTANELKPVACNGLNLTNIVSGSGTITGTSSNDLIIGSPGNDTINGTGGDDCILGAAGDDTIDGGDGADVCIGGVGADIFSTCETEIQ